MLIGADALDEYRRMKEGISVFGEQNSSHATFFLACLFASKSLPSLGPFQRLTTADGSFLSCSVLLYLVRDFLTAVSEWLC